MTLSSIGFTKNQDLSHLNEQTNHHIVIVQCNEDWLDSNGAVFRGNYLNWFELKTIDVATNQSGLPCKLFREGNQLMGKFVDVTSGKLLDDTMSQDLVFWTCSEKECPVMKHLYFSVDPTMDFHNYELYSFTSKEDGTHMKHKITDYCFPETQENQEYYRWSDNTLYKEESVKEVVTELSSESEYEVLSSDSSSDEELPDDLEEDDFNSWTDERRWEDLANYEQEAAMMLGWCGEDWNKGNRCSLDFMKWSDLDDTQIRSAYILGYDESDFLEESEEEYEEESGEEEEEYEEDTESEYESEEDTESEYESEEEFEQPKIVEGKQVNIYHSFERRYDSNFDDWYTRDEFYHFYGNHYMWDMMNPKEVAKRQAISHFAISHRDLPPKNFKTFMKYLMKTY